MSDYKQRSVKELYRPKDIIPTVIGVVCAITLGVFVANFATSYAGI